MAFYFRYALRALRRGGQRTVLVIISVAFGVMGLVAMQMLTAMITGALLGDIRTMRGGDLLLETDSGAYISQERIDQIEALKAEGRIENYTLTAHTYTMLIKPENGTKTAFVLNAMGVEPDEYPLVGEITIQTPEDTTFADTIRQPGYIAITRDLSDDFGMEVGDTVLVTDGLGGSPKRMVVGGVIEMPPSHNAKNVFYSLETAHLLSNNSQVITGTTLIASEAPSALAEELREDGWHVQVPHEFSSSQQRVRDIFNFGLKGAGMLALLVGGIGVANTMQVLLARRTTEIAVLKTMGYRRKHMLLMFGLETLLIGIFGSIIGLISGVLLAVPLRDSIESMGIFLLDWGVDIPVTVSGAIAGVVTTVIFGFYAIIQASAVRPALLLRQLSVGKSWKRWLSAVGVYAILALPFSVVSTFIMGSILQGLGVIVVALVGFIVMGLIMSVVLWIATHIPLPRIYLLTLARNSLKRQRLRLVFALIALFVGVLTIGFAIATIRTGQQEFDDRLASIEGVNLGIFGRLDDDAIIQEQLTNLEGIISMNAHYPAELASIEVQIGDAWQPLELSWMDGRRYDAPMWGLEVNGETWGGAGVYIPDDQQSAYGGLQPGMRVRLQGSTGTVQETQLSGFYDVLGNMYMSSLQPSVIVNRDLITALNGEQATVIYEGELEVKHLQNATTTLGNALPNAMIISADDIRAVMQGILFGLLSFVIAVAGLALVAGVVLIANAVGLAMIERRREIGVMKSVGYTSRNVLTTLILEYAQLGFIAGVLGVGAVAIGCELLRHSESDINLIMDFPAGLAVILVCIGLAVMSVIAVAWQPTHVPPLKVLRDE